MLNDGGGLENIVSSIEESLIPRGFTVEKRRRVFGDEGAQYAEFDLIISGSLGSAPVQFLIECRDRPSDGAAPGAWIEQLIGRRNRFRFDKVMAVSSSGFSPSAIDAAKDAKMELRTLESFQVQDIVDWLPANAPLLRREVEFRATRVFISDDGHQGLITFSADQPLIHVSWADSPQSILDLRHKLMSMDEFWRGVPEDGEPRFKSVVVSEYLKDIHSLDLGGFSSKVDRIEFDVSLRCHVPDMPLTMASRYSAVVLDSGGKDAIADVAEWACDGDMQIRFIGIRKRSGQCAVEKDIPSVNEG